MDAMVRQLRWEIITFLLLFFAMVVHAKEIDDTLRTTTRIAVQITYTTHISDGKCTLTINKVRKWRNPGCNFPGNLDDLVVMFFDKIVPDNDYGDIVISKESLIRLPKAISVEGYQPSKRGYFIFAKTNQDMVVGTFSCSSTILQIPIYLAQKEKNKKRRFWQKRGATEYNLVDDCGLLNVKVAAPLVRKETQRHTVQGQDSVITYVEEYVDSIVEESKLVTPDGFNDPGNFPPIDMGGGASDVKAKNMLNIALGLLNRQSSSKFEPRLEKILSNLVDTQPEVDNVLSSEIGNFLDAADNRKKKFQEEEVEQMCGRFLTALENCDNSEDLAMLNQDKGEIEKKMEEVSDDGLKEKLKDTLKKHQEKEEECNDKETRKKWFWGIIIAFLAGLLLFFGGIARDWIRQLIINNGARPSVRRLTFPNKYRWWQFWKRFASQRKANSSKSNPTPNPKPSPNSKGGNTVKDVNGKEYQIKKGKKKQKQNDKI